MKTLYIAGAFRGPDGFAVYMNVVAAERAMHELIQAALAQGTPVAICCPHSMTVHLDRTFNDEYWLDATLEWLDRSDGIFMLKGWELSQGATGEWSRARRANKPTFYDVPSAMSWLRESGEAKIIKSEAPADEGR